MLSIVEITREIISIFILKIIPICVSARRYLIRRKIQ